MHKFSHITTFSYIVLACSGIVMMAGCGIDGRDHAGTSPVALEIRFQGDTPPAPSPSSALRRWVEAAPGPSTHDAVARILVDITFADSGLPFFTNFDLTKLAPDIWRGNVPILPRNQQLRFAARALSASGDVAFSGETLATLTVDNQDVQIPLAPPQNGQTFQLPRMFRIVYPANMFAGQEEQVAFTILGNAGATIGIQITASGTPTVPSADFSPATGTVTLTNTVADFMAVYTPPEVTVDTDFDYQVTITDARAQSAVAITTNFRTHVQPRPPGGVIVHDPRTSVLFNPVIRSLTANGSETPGTVELVADVSDDSAPDKLTFQWSYTPVPATASATFANNGQGNPGLFQGYTVAHQGTITLAVTDEHNGTTTLHYQLGLDQFLDAIDHAVDGLKRIVAGNAHTCVLTGEGRVRCWGDNQFGQLGYGNTIDVGDASTRLPFTAGDVPLSGPDPTTHLPLDPVVQLVAGNNHTCVLLESGLVTCWGDNRFGQLGYDRTDNLGDTEPVTSFGYVTLGDVATRIAAGGDHTCAILQGGALRCWGRNDFGQLGRGNTTNIGDDETVFSAGNVDLGAGVTVKDLALGGSHTCALLTTGAVRCWGRNDLGQLGYGDTNNLGDNEPINNLPDVSLTGAVRKLVAGDNHTCALTFAGTLRCWGDGRFGQLGQIFGGDSFWSNAANELPSTLPSDINTGSQVIDVTAGDNHTCALSSDGRLKCWGLGSSGQLGYGDFNNQLTPPAAGVDLDGVLPYRITAGAAHTCALRINGTARCWGAGGDGRLGRGSTTTSATATGNVDIQIFASLTVGGTVSGLAGSGLVLRNNGGDDLLVNADGTFTFPTALLDLSAYAVTVRAQPTNRSQTCTVANGSGNLAGTNVTNVAITCVTNRYTVGGTVIGLTGAGLVLQDNGGDNLALSGDGSFTFATSVASGATFEVTVLTQPSQPAQTCTVSGGSGTVGGGNVTNVAVACTTNAFTVGGTVSGLAAGDSITLRDNGGDDLIRSANGSFTFATPVTSGQPYAVTVVNPTSPVSQTCTITNGSGTIGSGNVTNVAVVCTTNAFTVGGTVAGLAAGDSITLRDNGGDDLIRSSNGSFTFATPVASGQPYAVTIAANPTSPVSQTCTITNGAGTVGSGNVTNVAVVCTTNAFTVGGTVSGLAAGDSITLRDNGGDDLIRSSNGSFTFATPVASGQPYAVIVVSPTSPVSQTCTVTNSAGTIGGSNVTNVAVACTTNLFTIGGTVSGLAAGDSITLRDNGGDNLVRSANGSFTFATPVASGQPFAVTIVANPTSPISQTCTVTNGAGTVGSGNVTNVVVACSTNAFTVGGTVSGLAAGDSITLRDNGGDDLIRSSNGSFTFATPVASGQPYAVTIVANPTSPISQTCTVTNSAGTIGGSNVTNVAVACTTNLFTIGGTVSGLAAGDSITLRDNGGDTQVRSTNGSFTFATPVTSGQSYTVTVVSPTSPVSQTCTVANGAGTVGGGNVTNVAVTCTTNTFTVGGTVAGLTVAGLVLQNNGGNDLPISGSGGFTFTTPVASGATYNVTIKTQPLAETCTVANGTGTVGASNVTNVQVTCIGFTLSQFPIAVPGTSLGLGDVALDNNGDLLVTANSARSIVRVSRTTGAQSTVASNIGAAGSLVIGVAFRAANNTIYVSSVTPDGVTSQLFAVAPNGTTTLLASISGVLTIAIAPPTFGSFGGFIIGVTTNSTGTTGSVVAVNPTTGAVTTIVASAGPTSDLEFAPNGTLFICGAGTVRTVTAAGVMSTFASGFTSADGITITPDGARMFIADSGTDTVRQVTIPGAAVTTFASADIDDGFGVGGIVAAPGNTLIVMTGEASLTLRAFTF